MKTDLNQIVKAEGNCRKYDSQMGRSSWRGNPDGKFKFHLQRLRFVDYCYDLGGAYWGGPADLYLALDQSVTDLRGNEGVREFVRAKNRAEAKSKVLEQYPNARFYR